MFSSPEQNAPVFEQTQSQKILVEPNFNLQFVCTPFQTTASLRILIVGKDQENQVYKFQIKATNKQDYKVTQSEGQLSSNVNKIIYFYLKQSAPINKNLKDKFLLMIKKCDPNGQWQVIFTRKFAIIIESGLQKKPSQSIISPQTNSEMNNVSKFLSSVYSSPNSSDINRLYQPRSELRDVFLPPISSSNTMVASKYSNQNNPHSPLTTKGTYLQDDRSKKSTNSIQDAQIEETKLRPSILVSQSKKSENIKNSQINLNNITNYDPERLQAMLMEEQKLKIELNASIKQIEHIKRKILAIDSENKSNKARARFRIYMNIIIVIVGFLLGMWIKSLNIVTKVEHFIGSMKEKLSFQENSLPLPNQINHKGTQL